MATHARDKASVLPRIRHTKSHSPAAVGDTACGGGDATEKLFKKRYRWRKVDTEELLARREKQAANAHLNRIQLQSKRQVLAHVIKIEEQLEQENDTLRTRYNEKETGGLAKMEELLGERHVHLERMLKKALESKGEADELEREFHDRERGLTREDEKDAGDVQRHQQRLATLVGELNSLTSYKAGGKTLGAHDIAGLKCELEEVAAECARVIEQLRKMFEDDHALRLRELEAKKQELQMQALERAKRRMSPETRQVSRDNQLLKTTIKSREERVKVLSEEIATLQTLQNCRNKEVAGIIGERLAIPTSGPVSRFYAFPD